MAEVLLRHHLAAAAVAARVSSAGLYQGGMPATGHGQAAMASRGLDLAAHQSRQIDREMVAQADLIIGMAREHVREVAVLDPSALAKAFTLKELVARAEVMGPRSVDAPVGPWVTRLAGSRRRADLLGMGHDDAHDVADPVGRGSADYAITATLLDDLLGRFVALAWPAGVREGVA